MQGGLKLVGAAAVFYLGVVLWLFRAVVAAPSANVPVPADLEPVELAVATTDQDLVAFVISRNARNFTTSPSELFEAGQCYPMPAALTLGEPMLGEGLLGAPLAALTGDPVLSFNGAVLLTYWLGAIAAFALVLHWTGNAAAALVAGLLFGFHPLRFGDPIHPFVIASQWTILALLFADRLFQGHRWRDSLGLGVCLALQLLESFYTVVGAVFLIGVYGLHLLLAHRRRLPPAAMMLLPLALALSTALAVYLPYLHTREVWGALRDRAALLHFPHELAPGGKAFPGAVVLALAAIALAHRLVVRRDLGRGDGVDPRLSLAAAAFLIFWATVYFIPLPFIGSLPSLWTLLAAWVPGMDAVRSGASLRLSLYVALALLAGCGVAVLGGSAVHGVGSPLRRGAVAVVVALLWLAETFVPSLAERAIGRHTAMSARRFRPDEATVRLYESIDEGAVLDLPLAGTGSIAGNLGQASDYLRLHAYHRQPVAPCNNSFLTPVPLQINAIASQLPARAWKLDAVQALGFRFIVVHPDRVPADRRDAFLAALERLRTERTGHAYLVPVGGDGTRSLYRIDGQPEVQSALDSLSFEADGVAPPTPGETANFVLRVRNDSPTVFVQAEPVEPTRLLIRWYSEGAPVGEETVSALLPLALAAGDRQMVPVSARAPAASGDLIASISLARRPEDILAKARMVRN